MKYAVELTAGACRRVGRPVDRLDLWRQAQARAAPACLAISQSGKSPDIVAMAQGAQAPAAR